MKPKYLLIIFLLLAFAGGAWLFKLKTSLPDNNAISQDVSERLLMVDGYDSKVSEYALRSRFNLDSNYDRLARTTSLLDKSIVDMEATYFPELDIQNNLLHRRFNEYKGELEIKKDLVENFKSHNSVLRNSQKYAPAAGKELMNIAEKEGLTEISTLYSSVIKELLEYSLLGSTTSIERLKLLIPRLNEAEKTMPDYSLSSSIEFMNHIQTVIQEKGETDAYLSKALASTTDNSMSDLSKAWKSWISESNSSHEKYNQYLMWYIGFLLATIAISIWILRNLYTSLDKKVAQRTAEVEKAFEDLKSSQAQLVESEHMASLGQMAANVADEINTPLDYVSNSVDSIRLNMGDLDKVLDCVGIISEQIDKGPEARKNLGSVIKVMVGNYRSMRKRETINEIEGLLKGSSYGLNEISELVSSLKDFSRLDKADITETDVHSSIDEALSLCSENIGNRNIVKNYKDSLPLVECQSSKINQLFLNILTNAAQATDEQFGQIEVVTESDDNSVVIHIIDNGSGMDSETLQHIFEPFYTNKKIGEGSGLGLPICQKIIKSHGGKLTATSEPGTGTRFRIELPIKQSVTLLNVV